MKKLIIISQCSLFIFLASFKAGAQNNTAPAGSPEARAVNTEAANKAASKSSSVKEIKTPAVKPMGVSLQKTEASKQDLGTEPKPNITEQKTVEMQPNTYTKVEPKNIERPKLSTLTGLKNGDPLQLPVKKE